MAPPISETNEGLSSTIEWYLLNTLRNATDRIRPPRRNHRGNIGELPNASAGSWKLWNAARELNTQIRTTFTTLKLDVLLHWESEVACREADNDSESDSETDADDLPRLLRRLCGLLESRANISAIQDQTSLDAISFDYPNFGNLIEYIQSPSSADSMFDFIPNPKSGDMETSYLFNIASDAEVAAAFAALRDPTQKWPRKDMRRRMIEEILIMKECLSDVNDVVNRLRRSITSLTARPSVRAPSSKSFTSFNGLRSLRNQMYAACKVIISQFGACRYPTHRAVLQLPGWEDTTSSLEARHKLRLFINSCSKSIWQPANMCYLEPKIAATQSEQTLCECLEEAQDDDRDFEFYVPKESQEGIHVPRDPYSLEGRKEDPPLPNDNTNLWDLIVDGWFAKRPPMDLLIKTGQRKIELGIEQRRRLCVKLILGLMLSIDNDYPIVTWSPTSIFFLGDAVKNDLTPCVSICRVENNASQQESSILLAVSENSNVSNEPELLGIFIVMAKTLLGIAQGERLEMIRATGAYSELQRSRITLRRTIANRIDDATGKEPDIETLPFLEAAKRCLEFESQYRKLINMESSIVPIETAWQLIFKDILTTLDSNLTLPVEDPAQFLIAKRGSHTNSICLFDGENASGDLQAVEIATQFLDRLDAFHQTYASCRNARPNAPAVAAAQRRVRIAILDTGIDFTCPAVGSAKRRQRIREEWCHSWVGEGTDYNDEDDSLHGTNCVHLLHKSAPEADIYVAKVFSGTRFNEAEAENIAKAIDHAVNDWNVDIISMSFGMDSTMLSPVLTQGNVEEIMDRRIQIWRIIEDAMQKASVEQCIMFAAASNAGKNQSRAFPASSRCGVICVHASDGLGNDGGINPIAASGDNFMTLGMGHKLLQRSTQTGSGSSGPKWLEVHRSGTSFATPVAAGIAATILDLARQVPQVSEWARRYIRRPGYMRKALEDISNHGTGTQYPYRYVAPWRIGAGSRRVGETPSEVFASWINGVLRGIE